MKVNYQWHEAPTELPTCDTICVTYYKGGYSINMWDTYHNCWDDQTGDDYAMSADTKLKWMALDIVEEESK